MIVLTGKPLQGNHVESVIRDMANKRKYKKSLYKNWTFGFLSEINNKI